MALGTLASFISLLGLGGAGAKAAGSKTSSTTKKGPKGTDDAGKPVSGGRPDEAGGVSFRPKPEERSGRPSPTTRFPFGSSILGEGGRSLFPDTSVAGGSATPRQQSSGAGVSKRRKRTGFGIA